MRPYLVLVLWTCRGAGFEGSLDLLGLYVSGGKLHVGHLSPQHESKIDNLEKELSTACTSYDDLNKRVNKMK